jgi:hypothetical protein
MPIRTTSSGGAENAATLSVEVDPDGLPDVTPEKARPAPTPPAVFRKLRRDFFNVIRDDLLIPKQIPLEPDELPKVQIA